MKEIDARGLDCPAPVLQTKALLQEKNPDQLRVVLDNAASQQNVERFLQSQGFETRLDRDDGDYLVTGSRGTAPAREPQAAVESDAAGARIMVMCATDRMGHGDDELGLKLMVSYVRTLKEMGPELWRLVFVNNGVKLTIDGSEVLADLQEYEQSGLTILVCGTCLHHFQLLERKKVGVTTNMLDIVTAMQLADKVITV